MAWLALSTLLALAISLPAVVHDVHGATNVLTPSSNAVVGTVAETLVSQSNLASSSCHLTSACTGLTAQSATHSMCLDLQASWAAMVQAAGVSTLLQNSSNYYTLFAPVNSAINSGISSKAVICQSDSYLDSVCTSFNSLLNSTSLPQLVMNNGTQALQHQSHCHCTVLRMHDATVCGSVQALESRCICASSTEWVPEVAPGSCEWAIHSAADPKHLKRIDFACFRYSCIA